MMKVKPMKRVPSVHYICSLNHTTHGLKDQCCLKLFDFISYVSLNVHTIQNLYNIIYNTVHLYNYKYIILQLNYVHINKYVYKYII